MASSCPRRSAKIQTRRTSSLFLNNGECNMFRRYLGCMKGNRCWRPQSREKEMLGPDASLFRLSLGWTHLQCSSHMRLLGRMGGYIVTHIWCLCLFLMIAISSAAHKCSFASADKHVSSKLYYLSYKALTAWKWYTLFFSRENGRGFRSTPHFSELS